MKEEKSSGGEISGLWFMVRIKKIPALAQESTQGNKDSHTVFLSLKKIRLPWQDLIPNTKDTEQSKSKGPDLSWHRYLALSATSGLFSLP